MATVADVLTYMAVMDRSLRVATGEADEANAITAINIAQHQLELLAATMPRVLMDKVNVATVANTEVTVITTSILRIDGVQQLTNSIPVGDVEPIDHVGGHVPTLPWPVTLGLAASTGTPAAYFADFVNFYWLPKPDAAISYRVYGLIEKAEYAARGTTYAYPLRTKAAIAAYAAKVLRVGLNDDNEQLAALTDEIFGPLMRGLRNVDRSRPHARYYTEIHST